MGGIILKQKMGHKRKEQPSPSGDQHYKTLKLEEKPGISDNASLTEQKDTEHNISHIFSFDEIEGTDRTDLEEIILKLGERGYKILDKSSNRGTQGIIYTAETNEGEKTAIKIESIKDESDEERLKPGCSIYEYLQKLENPHIIKIYDNFVEGSCSCLIMEYIELSLEQLFDRKEWLDNLNEEIIINLTVQLCKALKDLHKKDLIHGDLGTLGNFLVRNLNPIEIALVDFGCTLRSKSQGHEILELESLIYKLMKKDKVFDIPGSIEEAEKVLEEYKASTKLKKLMLHLAKRNNDITVERILYSLVFDNISKKGLPSKVVPSLGEYKEIDTIYLHLGSEYENIILLTNLTIFLEHNNEKFKEIVELLKI